MEVTMYKESIDDIRESISGEERGNCNKRSGNFQSRMQLTHESNLHLPCLLLSVFIIFVLHYAGIHISWNRRNIKPLWNPIKYKTLLKARNLK